MNQFISEEELRKNYKDKGGLKAAINNIKKDLHIEPNSFKSWKGLFEIFNKNNLEKSTSDGYFISEKHRIGFCILKHQGNVFDQELGITKKHYRDEKLAKEWRNKMISLFHPDKDPENQFKDNKLITQKIIKIYNRMVGKA